MPPSPIRRRLRDPYAKAALGTYRGPQRIGEPPKLTQRVRRLLEAVRDKEVKAGQHGYRGHWRHHRVTVTAQIEPLLRCGWAQVVGAHLELTEAGEQALASAGKDSNG